MYFSLEMLVKPIHTCVSMSISHFTVTSAKQHDPIITCFKHNLFSSDPLSYVKFFFSLWPMGICFCFILSSFITESMLPIYSVPSISKFCCICFEVIIQELSNQSLIILSCGGSTMWMGSNLINTTFVVSIPLMTSAIPSA